MRKKNMWSRSVWPLALMLVLLAGVAVVTTGCAVDRATVDHRAAVMSGLADKINGGTADDLRDNALDVAWCLENERRAAVNLSDAFHWRAPTYKYPAKRPTELPWRPEDDMPVKGGR